MLYVLLILAVGAAVYSSVRFYLLKRSLRTMNEELREVMANLSENRIVRMPEPGKDIERLLVTINELLENIRQEAQSYAHREAGLKAQIEHISHDLRTPLTSIQGYLSFIDTEALSQEDREALAVVKRKANALQRLIVQYYELSRLNGDGATFEVRIHDVGRMLREVMTEHYQLLAGRGLAVSVTIPEHPVKVRADADALERILVNLLQNVERYAVSEMWVTLKEQDAQVVITIANDLAIASLKEDEVEKLFLPFYTGSSARTQSDSQESSGLGLSIARGLAERMGMRLDACLESQGDVPVITFKLVLPQ